ncbi:hypothetical protein RO3G_16354 [Rhizopus delemar RA 99-880]|uniref:Uncharacterized protein n=1 Tax=Rhizopus delemar (strain RA 99-880 / ATCC MYA-4621 / FGSC 9543 / NRRL 43880) TaxID=246409 RepID=I1CT63_RHIO9|nr:hypothetical protein RO3G_16354 [Rhizopus delemar RA 99-880]|eukprot:EIE91643.1 hypothetical protein RO3G_16354 [Rhizopus delemar RA 99-880]
MFTELKVSKITLFDFVKQHCNLSLKKARLQPIDRNSEEKIQERLDWVLWYGQRKVHQQWSQFPKREQQQRSKCSQFISRY